MTPQEFDAMIRLLEETSEKMYRQGMADHAAEKVTDKPFKIGKANRFIIKSNFEKLKKTR